MVRLSYGPQPKKRAKRLFEALLNFANDQFEEGDRLKIQLNTQTERQLIVRTKVRYLEQLTALDSYEGKLSGLQIKEALKQLKDGLEILKDNRTSTRGSDNWHFTLKLWHHYYEIDANIHQFEEEWERRRPEQSKLVTGEITTPKSKSRSQTRKSTWSNYPPYFFIAPPVENLQAERERPYHNLPAPDHTVLIGRQQQITQLLEWLSFNNPVYRIGIQGIAGAGKTTLMLEVARRCYHASRSDNKIKGVPTFEAIIFTSAKPNRFSAGQILPRLQRERTLRDIFRAIATTLGLPPDLLVGDVNEQLPLIRDSLSRQQTLLLLDNLETIEQQQDILSFLYELPSTVKVIVTTRVQVSLDVSICLEVLPKADGLKLIEHQAQLKQLQLSPSDAVELYQKTSGLPIAIVYTLGQLAVSFPLNQVLAKLTEATGDIAHFCFEESVKPLRGKISHKLLMALALFPQSALQEAIARVAGSEDAVTTTDSLVQLQQLSLVKCQQGRYDLLPLTRYYILQELNRQSAFEKEAKTRWIDWYLQFVEKQDSKDWQEWNEYDELEKEWDNIVEVIEDCIVSDRYADVQQFWQYIKGYSHILGYKNDRLQYWNSRLDWTDWLVQSAKQNQDWKTAAEVLFDRGWTLTLMGQEKHLKAAEPLLLESWKLRQYQEPNFQINLAIYLGAHYLHQRQLEQSNNWLTIAQTQLDETQLDELNASRHWIHLRYYQGKICFYQENYELAKCYYEEVLKRCQSLEWQRASLMAKNWLGDIAIEQGETDEARTILEEVLAKSQEKKDKNRVAFGKESMAYLEKDSGNFSQSRRWAIEAKESFISLGMIPKADELSIFLENLKTED